MAKILIIDNRAHDREYLSTLLSYQRHCSLETEDGAEGLRVAREERPDLIISDVLMPTMDGYEFVRRLREDPAICGIPVVFSTAHYLSRECQALADRCGVTSTIFKPCEPQVVMDIIEAALSGHPDPAPTLAKPQEFDREHLQLLTNKLSEKADQVRDAHRRLTALIELSTEVAEERDPVELLNRYCSVAREVISSRWTLVALLERDQKTVHHLAAAGIDLEDTPALRSALLETGIFKTLVNEGGAIRLRDVTSTPGALRLPGPLPRAESLLVVPLIVRGRIDGWICLADKLGLDAFSEQDERLAVALAAKMAIGYDNARLYSDSMKFTEKLEAEMASELRYRRLFESANDGILILDADSGQIVDVNPYLIEMLAYAKEDLVGRKLWEIGVFKDIAASRANFAELQQRGFIRYEDLPLETRYGVVKPVEFVSNSYLEGESRVIQCNIRGISGRKQAEVELREANQHLEQALRELRGKSEELASMTRQLWQASKLATMGELAASIAHELNNPLATVALRAESLLAHLPVRDQVAVDVILREVERMASLVSNLLQFSRRSHQQISTIDLRAELRDSLEFIQYHLHSRKVEIVQYLADDLPTIQADRQQLQQMFLNLLTNASDAMPRGGTLTVRAHPGALENGEAAVVIEFSDTGIGISDEDLPKLWEAFFTTKQEGKGTGLGLPICRRTVEEHRGTINIESWLGKGTTVRIMLPTTKKGLTLDAE
jgi:PAS domain S-box-containing protein